MANETEQEHDDHEGHGHNKEAPRGIFVIFVALAAGLLLRQIFRRSPIPYSVLLICFGMAIGAIFNGHQFEDYTAIAKIDPHLLLLLFLPVLIFESAFTMDVHTFFKNARQILTLAAPGLLISAFLTSCIARFIFSYNWSWPLCLVFGAVLSATDPVAVVAILKELGAPKQLGTIIEGESLLNDGAAIVLFNVLHGEVTGNSRNGGEIVLYFMRVALGGPLFGWIAGKVVIFWLSHVFNDYLIEITITLVSTYLTYYIGEEVLHVSGVLAVVAMGIEVNTKRTVIEPDVEEFLHRFWEIAGYIANTLIFVLVGVIITQEAFSGVTYNDWLYLFLLYFLTSAIRLVSIEGLNPILTHLGYGFSGKTVLFITWGGLRGAVGLSLALVVTGDLPDEGHKVLFHVAGIVVLTLLLNATTIKYLLKGLGFADISEARLLAMVAAIKRIREAQKRAITTLKADKFLVDAHWEVVERSTYIHDPYKKKGPKEVSKGTIVRIMEVIVGYVKRHTVAPVLTKAQQHEALEEEIRQRMVKAQKISYWRQFQQGLLGRDAARILIALADNVLSDPGRFLCIDDLKFHWEVPYLARKARKLVEKVKSWKSASRAIAPPSCNWAVYFFKLATHKAFDWLMIITTVIYCSLILTDVILNSKYRALEITIHMFFPIYIGEFVIKNIGLRKHYWKNVWDLFDFILLPLTLVDIIIVEGIHLNTYGLLQLIRIMRLLRLIRTLGLIKRLAPFLLSYIDNMVNEYLRLGYDIGKGFLTGEEDMMQQFGRLALMDEEQTRELKEHSDFTRIEVIKSLGQVRRLHPTVVLSVKTHQASRSVLNYQKEIVNKLHNLGLIEQVDQETLLEILAFRIKKLHSSSASISPPNPTSILIGVSWLSGLDSEVIAEIIEKAEMVSFDSDDVVAMPGQEICCLYVIISGIVQVSTIITKIEDHEEDESEESSMLEPAPSTTEKKLDIIGAGSILNDMAILIGEEFSHNYMRCETDVQMFAIIKEDVLELLSQYPPVAEKMWKSYGTKIGIPLLQELPEYQDWTATKLLLLCARAFIVSGSALPNPLIPYEITEDHMHVVLIHGEARRLSTKERLEAPCLIPRSAKHLLLSVGSPKLMVIPTGEFDTEEMDDISTNSSVLFPEETSTIVTFIRQVQQFWENCKRTDVDEEDSKELMQEVSVIDNVEDTNMLTPTNTASQDDSNNEISNNEITDHNTDLPEEEEQKETTNPFVKKTDQQKDE